MRNATRTNEHGGAADGAGPRSDRGRTRRQLILRAATEQFLEIGYGETSVDAIVARAGGSKATLYSYFPSKRDLFRAVIDSIVLLREGAELDPSNDVRTEMVDWAVKRLGVLFSKQHRALMRLIVSERDRFPDIARSYYQRGPGLSRKPLADYLGALQEEGVLHVRSPEEAAEFFIGMLVHEWYVQQLYLNAPPPTTGNMLVRAQYVVDRFLDAFRR
jgi:AcrR family transcriptional regulator